MRRLNPESGLLLVSVAVFAVLLLKHISYPVLWQDEAETAVFGERVLEYGYPKVHGPRNVLYEFGSNIAVGVKESQDAYIGTTWGHFYFAVPGLIWAHQVDDRYAKTARLRIPFALAGGLGVACWALALLPAFRGRPRRAALFAALYFLLAASSVSLLLHLREVRYYPLLVLLFGALASVELRYRVFGALRRGSRAWLSALLLVAVFHTFFAAWFIWAGVLSIDAWLASAGTARRGRTFLAEMAPVLLSGLLIAPALVFFETLSIVNAFRADLGLSVAGYLANLSFVGSHFLRHEWLAPAVASRLAVAYTAEVLRARGIRDVAVTERAISLRLAVFAGLYVAVTCANPLVYERYFVPLVPVVNGVFLLDAFALVAMLRRFEARHRRRFGTAVALALGFVIVATSGPRVQDLRGRFFEITHRYRGPLDFAIEHIAESAVHPEDLVIATNYANHPLMYYLGSHVIVGTNLNNILAERRLEPDWVIVRRRWPRGQAELRAFLARGEYEQEVLAVRDTYFNNVPALTRSASTPEVHRFATPALAPGERDRGLVLHRRIPRAGAPAGAANGRSESDAMADSESRG